MVLPRERLQFAIFSLTPTTSQTAQLLPPGLPLHVSAPPLLTLVPWGWPPFFLNLVSAHLAPSLPSKTSPSCLTLPSVSWLL